MRSWVNNHNQEENFQVQSLQSDLNNFGTKKEGTDRKSEASKGQIEIKIEIII